MNQSKNKLIIRVKKASLDEADSIAPILCHAFAEYRKFYTEKAFLVATPSINEIKNRWDEGPVWLALLNEKAVATIAAVVQGKSLYIRSLGVLPDARGYGLGSLLLQEVENFGKQYAFKRLFLSTATFLHYAIQIYKKNGFVRTMDLGHELEGMPLFTMQKPIL